MGDDELDGGDGEDTLQGGSGADTLTGGEDDDTASYAGSTMGVTVRLHASQAMGGDAEGDVWGDTVTVEYSLPDEDGEMQDFEETVPDIVNLTGSAMDDILAGDSRGNTIMGGDGDDKIYGGPGGGDDMLHGGKGDDMIFGGWGSDILAGGAGDDMLNGGKEADAAGVDTYYGGAGSDMIYANPDDTINGWYEEYADADDDGKPDSPYMGPPDDLVATPDDNDPATNEDESTEGGSDPKAVDTVSFARLEKAVNVAGANPEDDPTRWTLEDKTDNVENLVGTSENDMLGGSDGVPNVIEGGDGADDLTGGSAADTANDPDDTVSYRNSDRRVNVDLSGETHVASGGHAQGDTIAGFENVIGSAHDDILVGDATANKLTGLAGDDDITGGNGGDTINGGPGADELDGDDGRTDDQTQLLRAGDTLSYAGSSAAVRANLAINTYSGGDAEGDEVAVQRGDNAEMLDHDMDPETDALDVSSFENLTGSDHNDRLTGDHRMNTIMGGDGDDTISGGGEFDVLMGQKGDDTLMGGAGTDHLVGGPGADRLEGGEMRGERDNMVDAASDGRDNDGDNLIDDADTDETGMVAATIDWAVYRPAEAGVEVDLSNNRGTGGDAMGDRLIGIELVWGSMHDDTFIASADEDTFDIIHGDSGADTVSYEASEVGVTVNLGTDNNNDGVTFGGMGTPSNPYTFDYDPTTADTTVDDPTIDHVDADGVAGNPATNGAAGDRLGGIQNLTGSNQKDDLSGDANPNVLKGMGGNDEVFGADGNDILDGGAGRDNVVGGDGEDRLTGGVGNDELTGSTIEEDGDPDGDNATDTFVFDLGHGDDIINDFEIGATVGAGDRIDLSAFELDPEDLAGMISKRGTGTDARVVIDLRDVGGGTIELVDVTNVDALDLMVNDPTTDDDGIDESDDGVIQVLNVYDVMTNDDGVFIL